MTVAEILEVINAELEEIDMEKVNYLFDQEFELEDLNQRTTFVSLWGNRAENYIR